MIEQLYSENSRKIMQNKKAVETAFKIKLSSKNSIINIQGKPEDEYIAFQAIEALNMGFALGDALLLKNEDFIFEKINIKNIAKRRDLSQVRARVIGTKGKALRVIEDLSNCYVVLHNNNVGIIGFTEDVKKASFAIKRLIAGSKHASVFSYLEEQKALEKQSF